MKTILHSLEIIKNQKGRVPSEEVNYKGLLRQLSANENRAVSKDWLEKYEIISEIYTNLFSKGEVPEEMIINTDEEILEMAYEVLEAEPQSYLYKPSNEDLNYYYEFCRSYGVSLAASELEEYIEEECDFL